MAEQPSFAGEETSDHRCERNADTDVGRPADERVLAVGRPGGRLDPLAGPTDQLVVSELVGR